MKHRKGWKIIVKLLKKYQALINATTPKALVLSKSAGFCPSPMCIFFKPYSRFSPYPIENRDLLISCTAEIF